MNKRRKIKPILLAFLLILSLYSNAGESKKTSRVVDFESANTLSFSVNEVSLRSKETHMFCSTYYLPGRTFMIPSSAILRGKQTGRVYKMLRCDSIELDSQKRMSDSGFCDFSMVFEPISRADSLVDYVENDNDSAIAVSGIRIRGDKREKLIECVISGNVIDRPQTSCMIIAEEDADLRVNKAFLVPVRGGRYSYKLKTNEVKAYKILCMDEYLMGSYFSIVFFAENSNVGIDIYPKHADTERSMKSAGVVNKELIAYMSARKARLMPTMDSLRAVRSILYKENRYHTPLYKELMANLQRKGNNEEALYRMYKERDSLEACGAFLTAEAKNLKVMQDSILLDDEKRISRYVSTNATPFSLWLLLSRIKRLTNDTEERTRLTTIYTSIFADKFYNHSYAEGIRNALRVSSFKVGEPYFSSMKASDIDGNTVDVVTNMRGKYVIVDLWASWCAPCRHSSKELIPLYEKYKNRGFMVVAIARERGNTKNMEKAMLQDGYPWSSLVDLNDSYNVWELHGIGNGGGSRFLISPDGILMAKEPTVESLERVLREKLGNQ